MSTPETLSTAQGTVATLLLNGFSRLYALPGVQNDPLFDALHGVRDRLRVLHTRHEQGAAYMALGDALATGRPAAYAVVPGPGFLNTTAALASAYAANAPVLALVGQIPQAAIGRQLGMLHELPDQLATLRLLTKWAARIDGPADAPRLIDAAIRTMLSGRPRPVGLECPMDVWPRRAPVVLPATAATRAPLPVDDDAIEVAARLLGAAERPLIVVGGGAQDAGAEVRAVAELLEAPVVAHRMGRGVLDSRHPLSVNFPAAHRLWREADVVLGVGTRLQTQQMVWGVDDTLKVVRIDADPAEVHRFRPAEVGIVAHAAEALRRLAERLPAHNRRRDRAGAIAGLKAEVAADVARLQPQVAYLDAIRAALPEDGILVDELTQVGYAARLAFPVYRPRTFLAPGYQGTLGWGYAAALGAKAARPDVPVVSIAGDGGFLFNVQELSTAMAHRLAVVVVVFNDGAFGNVRRFQQERFEGRFIASELTNPDFVTLAGSFGMRAERVDAPAALGGALARAIAADEPALIEVTVGPMPSPWRLIHMPRVR